MNHSLSKQYDGLGVREHTTKPFLCRSLEIRAMDPKLGPPYLCIFSVPTCYGKNTKPQLSLPKCELSQILKETSDALVTEGVFASIKHILLCIPAHKET